MKILKISTMIFISFILLGCLKIAKNQTKWDHYLMEVEFNSCISLLYQDFNNYGLKSNLVSDFLDCKSSARTRENFPGISYEIILRNDYMVVSSYNKKYKLSLQFDSRVTDSKDVRSLDYLSKWYLRYPEFHSDSER